MNMDAIFYQLQINLVLFDDASLLLSSFWESERVQPLHQVIDVLKRDIFSYSEWGNLVQAQRKSLMWNIA